MARVKPLMQLFNSTALKLVFIALFYVFYVLLEIESREFAFSFGLHTNLVFHAIALLCLSTSVLVAAFFFYKTRRKNLWLGATLVLSIIAVIQNRANFPTALLYSTVIILTYAAWLAWQKHGSRATSFILGEKPKQPKTHSKENKGKTFEEKLEEILKSKSLQFRSASKNQDPDYEINTKNGRVAVLIELGSKRIERIIENTMSKSRNYSKVILVTTQETKRKLRERIPDLNAVILTEDKALDYFTINNI